MGRYGETFKCSADGLHRSDHIRDFLLEHKDKAYWRYASNLGIERRTLMNYANGCSSTSVDIVEGFLNEMGYTLKVVPLERR